MGEVYLARDTKLQREVAIKVLPEALAHDPERLARLEREARTLALLNHPHIAQIHGLEESDGIKALIMELVEGSTLADRIAQGPIPTDEALPIAKQIAEALQSAHEHGIIHRDLKPANIKLREDGTVKVLDFGLAKAMESTASSTNMSLSPTITSPAMTQMGVILGTAAYMAPEQAKGRRVDERTDIWAFGCVLYEMLTGKRAFEGEDVSDTLAAVLRGAPDWSVLPSQLSPTLLVYLQRCLTRDPAKRVHDIADVRLALEGAFDVPIERVSAASPVEVRQAPWRLIVVGTAVIAASAAVLGGLGAPILFPGRPPSVVRLTATPPNGVLQTPTDPDVAVSADGYRIAYATIEQGTIALYVRSLDQLDAIRITGVSAPRAPFFSPDGQSIGFFDGQALKQVAASGGPPMTVTPMKGTGRGASWGADDSIIFATSDATGLLRVSAKGGEVRVLTEPKSGHDHFFPQVLPGGRAVLFTIVATGQASSAQIAVLDLGSGTQTVLLSGGSHGQYAASGHLVYGAAGTLRAVGFDLDTLTIRGSAVPVVEQVVTKGTGAANFAMSRDGSLVYESGDIASVAERTLVWVDRQGREEVIAAAPKRSYVYPRISPDGTRVALDIRDQQNDIWVWDLTRPNLARLTFDPGLNRGVAWTPDGKTLVFSAERDGTESLFWQAADASGSPERLTAGQPGRPQVPNSVAADGARLVFSEPDSQPHDLYTLQLDSERKVLPLLNGSYDEHNGEVSPNGRWLAYQSDESGSTEIYVRPFPNVGDSRTKISTGGGTRPVWARNGRELFYLKVDGTMVAVPIHPDSGGRFSAGTPTSLFQGVYFATQSARTYDVAPDGSRFLMIKSAAPSSNSATVQLVVVQHWFEELKRLVPTK